MTAKRSFIVLLLFCVFISCVSIYAESADTAALNKRNKFIENAKQLLGTPYVYGGTSKNGIDCSGLVFIAAKGIGLTLPRTASQMCEYAKIIEDSDRQPGDLLFFSDNGKRISHVSIYLGDGKMIHSASDGTKTGVIISSVTESYWKKTYYCAGRIIDAVTAVASAPTTPTTTNEPKPVVEEPTQSIPSSGVVIATVNKEDKQERKEQVQSQSDQLPQWKEANPFFEKIALDCSVAGGWSLISAEKFGLVFRGLDAQVFASYGTDDMKPGLGIAFDYDPSMNISQFKLMFSFIANKYIRIYAGPAFTIGTPVLPGSTKEISASIFPGVIGASFQTPTISIGKLEFSICQDVSITIFNKTDGSALSIGNSAAANVKLLTGVRVTIPHL